MSNAKIKKCLHIVGSRIKDEALQALCTRPADDDAQSIFIENQRFDLLIINAHGSIGDGRKHFITLNEKDKSSIESALISTEKVFASIDRSSPVNVLLSSCYSGTNTKSLIKSLPHDSALITASKEYKPSLIAIDNNILENFSADYYDNQQNFAQVFLDRLPILASSFGKFTTHWGVFALRPEKELLLNEKNTREFLQKSQKEFIEFIQQNHPENIVKSRTISDDDIASFSTAFFLYLCDICDTTIPELLEQNRENDYLYALVSGHINGNTPLLVSVGQGYNEVVKLLLQFGAEPDIANNNGLTPLQIAAGKGHVEVVELLLKFGASPDIASKGGYTPLQIAALKGHKEVVELLLKFGASPDIASKGGFTPLYWAAQEGHVEIVKSLLKFGAKPDIASKDGYTPLDIADYQDNKEIIKLVTDNCLEKDDHNDCLAQLKTYANFLPVIEEQMHALGLDEL